MILYPVKHLQLSIEPESHCRSEPSFPNPPTRPRSSAHQFVVQWPPKVPKLPYLDTGASPYQLLFQVVCLINKLLGIHCLMDIKKMDINSAPLDTHFWFTRSSHHFSAPEAPNTSSLGRGRGLRGLVIGQCSGLTWWSWALPSWAWGIYGTP